MGSGLPFNSF